MRPHRTRNLEIPGMVQAHHPGMTRSGHLFFTQSESRASVARACSNIVCNIFAEQCASLLSGARHKNRGAVRAGRRHRCGGATLAQEMAKDLAVSVIVEDKPGAGTIIGTQAVAVSEP